MVRIAKPEMAARQLSLLLRRPVTVTAVNTAPAQSRLCISGAYHGSDGALLGHCLADLSFAAHAGAALSLVPADVAEDNIRRRTLEDTLRENFAEVLNVLSCLFTVDDARVTLRETVFPPQPLPGLPTSAPAAAVALLQVDISGYGTGLLSVRTVP